MSAFTLNQADLEFILRQIKVAEAHADGTALTSIYVDAQGNVVSAATPGAVLAIPDPHVPVGLRTVDGRDNSLIAGRETWGASGEPMPRLFEPNYVGDGVNDGLRDLDGDTFSPGGPPITNNNYAAPNNVADADPRIISNLIVDMTINNPAALVAALAFAGISGGEALAIVGQVQALMEEARLAHEAVATAAAEANAAVADAQLVVDAATAAQTDAQTAFGIAQSAQASAAADVNAAELALAAALAAEAAHDAVIVAAQGGVAAALANRETAEDTAADTESAKNVAAANLALAQQVEQAALLAFQAAPSPETSAAFLAAVDAREEAELVHGTAVEADEDADAALVIALDAHAGAVDVLQNALLQQVSLRDAVELAQQALEGAEAVLAGAEATLVVETSDLAEANAALADAIAARDAIPTGAAATEAAQAAATAADAAVIDEIHAHGVETIGETLVIPNVAPDEGLSAPFNAWMTFFGQFFDHGLDLISKGGNGTVYVPLAADDPLVLGADGQAGTPDDLPVQLRFMAITRSTNVDGADGEPTQRNVTTSFVDQNQTYTSHASHQVFLREYAMVDGKPVATGKLLGGEEGGLATWADVKAQAAEMLGIELTDMDVFAVPLLRTDAYGNFIPDQDSGFPQLILGVGADGIPNTIDDVVVSGTPDALVNTFAAGAIRTNNAFLDDIAHDAVPGTVFDPDGAGPFGVTVVQADDNDIVNDGPIATDSRGRKVAYDDELLDRHFITGDGRGNENIGLTTVHHVFHSEHNRQVDAQKLTILRSGDLAFINEWLAIDIDNDDLPNGSLSALQLLDFANSLTWDGERLFQAARFATEMQYQHLVFEEFARKIQPMIDVFVFNSITDIDPTIFSEFANVVYRFGHSMLTENMPRIGPDGQPLIGDEDLGLIEAFLNPVRFDNDGALTHDEGAAAIVRGMTIERGNEIDEFVVDALRNNLLGLPLDLAAINIARGRDTGMPTLNEARQQLFAASGSTFLTPYTSWTEFAANLKNPLSVVNFIAAYGTHPSIPEDGTLEEKRDAAWNLVFGNSALTGATATAWNIERLAFLNSTGAYTAQNSGLNSIDLWIGGLAEKKMPFGGMLGSTFNAVFELQMENLQDGDRFYYLTRTQGQNFLNMLEQNSFAKMIMANTNLAQPGADGIRGTADDVVERHIGVDSFAAYDYVLEVNPLNQADQNGDEAGIDPTGNDPVLEAIGLGKVQRNDPGTAGTDENYLRFTGGEHVVAGGTNGNDTIITDFGDDGIWGDAGNDRIESGAGVDLVNGGAGNDIITDSGDTGDFIKGDEGDDVIANSNGIDILMGGSGKDAIFVGVDATEVFAGEGDDFVLGGADMDLLMGNEGDDWIEAGAGFDTTAGDNSELFFNSAIKGHDVMFAGSDEHDFDAESGDDIMVQGESVMRNEGMFGFDWAIFKGMSLDGYADMRIPIFTTEQEDILRNRFDKTEALSGWENDDTLWGDDRVFGEIAPGDTVATTENIFFNDGLDQAGIDRIAGLSQIVSVGASGFFESGNILLGGAGNDKLRGNGGDDILDGDRWLNVRIRITGDATDANTASEEIATVDSMNHVFTTAEANAADRPAWAGRSLFDLMIDRQITPGQMHIVREVVTTGASAGDQDVAYYNDSFLDAQGNPNYTITRNPDGSIRIAHVNVSVAVDPLTERNLVSDGIDTLRNVEFAEFADGTRVGLTPPQLFLDPTDPGEYADDFTTSNFGNSDGATAWNPDWIESNDGANAVNGGQIQIDTGGSNAMRFLGGLAGGASDGAQIQRVMDLSGATTATLGYSANPNSMDAGESVQVWFSANGTDFVLLNTITGDGANTNYSHTLSGPFASTATVRFVASSMNETNDVVSIDNLAVNFEVAKADPVHYDTTFTEDQNEVSIASGPRIDGVGQIVSARIVLTNAQQGDTLQIPNNLPGNINSTVDTTVPGQITVNLIGNETPANYQAAIQAIEFENTSENPSTVDRVINVTVSNGLFDSNVATTTVNVNAVNDAPNAVIDSVITNGNSIVVPEWVMLLNDTDAEGSALDVDQATENDAGFAIAFDGDNVTATRSDNDATKDFTYRINDGQGGTDTADVDIVFGSATGTNGSEILLGDGANTTFAAQGGNDIVIGGLGNDTVDAGTGDDTIYWSANASGATDGRDIITGGLETVNGPGDTFVINGNATTETYNIYSRAAWTAAGNTLAGLNGQTEIIITRNGTNAASVIAELREIEEIRINSVDASGTTGTAGGDTFNIFGNFAGTNLRPNTITINGNAGNDTVDVTALESAHRILFRSNGGNDTIVGTLRPQDVIELPVGTSIDDYTATANGNGTTTYSNGTNSITFVSTGTPQFQETPPPAGNDEGVSGAFEYTPSDIAGLKALVNGQQPEAAGDDDVPLGVRELSGYGNNIANPTWGSADQAFIRLTDAHYGAPDANGNRAVNPIFNGLDPRTISNILGTQEAGLPAAGNEANIFFMAMGQYIDHGLDFLPKGGNGSIQIGAPGGGGSPTNPADLTRGTVVGYDADGNPQHKNQTSPYIDQNQAYGSNSLIGQFLRESDGNQGHGMKLLAGAPDPSNPDFSLLPTLRELIQHHWDADTIFTASHLPGGSISFRDYYTNFAINPTTTGTLIDPVTGAYNPAVVTSLLSNFMGSTHPLLLDANPFINVLDHFIAGDGRANENFALTAIHTIWARNHNHHVDGLLAAGFQGTDEEVFQAAKMINEAEYQRVVFDEYLETLLGGLRSEGTHGFEEYDPNVNPAISHEFAAAVFRFGHSLIGQSMTVLDASGNPTQVSLFDAFLNPSNDPSVFTMPLAQLAQHGYVPKPGYAQHGVNNIIGGTITQASENVDFNIVDAVRNDLVRISADLFAFNVARGWDVGLGTLNQIRKDLSASTSPYVEEAVGFAGGDLSAYTSWEDFQQRNELSDAVIAQFRQAYPDLVLAAADIAAFQSINPDIEIAMQGNGTGIVKGIDRLDLWVGGLAEKHINDGIVGQTFWVVLSEQFERLQDGDRFYYIDRFDNFDFYENFIDGQEFADIVARNTGMTDLPEHMFRTEEIDQDDDEDEDDTDTGNDDDEDDDDDTAGEGDTDDDEDDDEDEEDEDDEDDDEDEDEDEDEDDEDGGTVTPPPVVVGLVLAGTAQTDVLTGGTGDDSIVALAGDDVVVGNAGDDAISGGEGGDLINGGAGRDVIFAGIGDDQVFGGDHADMIYGDAGADRLFGGDGNDMITAGAGDDQAFGGAGNDLFVGEAGDGNDVYFGDDADGGTGTDTLDLSAATVDTFVNLGSGAYPKGTATSTQTGNDTIWGIENVNTGSGNDTIIASNAANVMNGGAGNDTYRFMTAAAADGDTILGFAPGDRVDLSSIDANTGTAANDAFTLITGAEFTAAGQLAVSFESRADGDFTVIQGNVNGDLDADFTIEVEGHHQVSNANVIV